MLKTFLPFKGPSTWYFVDPDTGQDFQASTKEELVQKILAYRSQNNLPDIFQLSHVIDHYLCGRPENLGKCGKNPRIHRSWWTTLKGGVTLLVNLLCNNPVKQEEADRRASICVKCPYNGFPDKTSFVKWSDRIAESTVPGRRSAFHNQLGNCEVCTCVLKAKVWMPGPFDLSKEEKEKMKEVGCWQVSNKES